MAKIIWTEPAQQDLEDIADHIAIDDPEAAGRVVARILNHVEQPARHPFSGPVPPELEGSKYRQLVEPPCRIFYSVAGRRVFILHVLRFERLLRPSRIEHSE